MRDGFVNLFRLDQALALLPRVIAAVKAIREERERLDTLQAELASLSEPAPSNGHSGPSRREVLRRQAIAAGAAIEASVAALRGLGVELKGLDPALIDFPSERDGRVVYLCWREGEDTISHWHEIEAGFAGRQPL